MTYIERLMAACESAKNAKDCYTRVELTITPENMKDQCAIEVLLTPLKGTKNVIYIFEDQSEAIDQTFQNLENYKSTRARACPRTNDPSKTMYVGSSIANIQTRLRQHIGMGPDKTYALHLSHWYKGSCKITARQYDSNLSPDVLQIIEDDLSDSLKPAFGKQGGNNW